MNVNTTSARIWVDTTHASVIAAANEAVASPRARRVVFVLLFALFFTIGDVLAARRTLAIAFKLCCRWILILLAAARVTFAERAHAVFTHNALDAVGRAYADIVSVFFVMLRLHLNIAFAAVQRLEIGA